MKRFLCLGLALCIMLFSLAACGAADNGSASIDLRYSKDTLTEDAAPESSYGATGTTTGLSTPNVSNRKMIRNADLSVDTKKFDDFISALDKKITEMEGYIESSEINNANYSRNYRRATVVARIPADDLDSFINAVGKLGSISYKNITSNDVTSQYIDTESRISALKTEQQSLMELLKTATALDDILEIQDRLSDVTGELESYQAQLNTYDSLVSYSTVTLQIREVELDPTNDEQGFWSETGTRLVNNLYSIGAGAKAIAMWLISSLPYIILIALIALAIWLPIRRSIRRKKAAKQAQSTDK